MRANLPAVGPFLAATFEPARNIAGMIDLEDTAFNRALHHVTYIYRLSLCFPTLPSLRAC